MPHFRCQHTGRAPPGPGIRAQASCECHVRTGHLAGEEATSQAKCLPLADWVERGAPRHRQQQVIHLSQPPGQLPRPSCTLRGAKQGWVVSGFDRIRAKGLLFAGRNRWVSVRFGPVPHKSHHPLIVPFEGCSRKHLKGACSRDSFVWSRLPCSRRKLCRRSPCLTSCRRHVLQARTPTELPPRYHSHLLVELPRASTRPGMPVCALWLT